MSQHPQAVREFIRDNNYQDVADLLKPPQYNRVGKLTVQHYRRARELSWENLDMHGFNVASVRGETSKPPAGEVFAVITPGDEPLQVRPDVACRVIPKGSGLAYAMMVTRMEAEYATFSDAQTLARYIIGLMNARTSSSSMGWISRERKYIPTLKSFLDTTQYDLAGRPVPPSQRLGGPKVTSSTATFRPIGGMSNRPIQSERDEAPPLKKSKAEHQVVQGAMSGMQTPRMEWRSSRPREMQDDSHEIFPSPLENPSDSVYPVMDISDFATDNGPFNLEEGQVPPSASTAGMVQRPLTNPQSTAQHPMMTSQYQSIAALASQYPEGVMPAIAMTQVREPTLVESFKQDELWTLCIDYDRYKRDGGRAPIDRFIVLKVANALRDMVAEEG
jgi:hypothetical protein